MSRRRGESCRVREEATLSERPENSSLAGQASLQDPLSERQDKMVRGSQNQTVVQRRILRSQYHALKTSIAEQREDILRADCSNFDSIFNKVQSLHEHVQKPREQVADAETLFDITKTLFATVKRSQNSDGVMPVDFISSILQNYSNQALGSQPSEGNDQIPLSWKNLGLLTSSVFKDAAGASTLLGPMESEPKQRKSVVQRKRFKPTEKTRPEEVKDSTEETSETDKNMATMFNILRKQKAARLEWLVLNRQSFSQTVENIFALSFLVKDGRVEISLDKNGNHFIAPKNAPTAKELQSGEASYSQFVFRFDFKDWKLMQEVVESGQELMPHRTNSVAVSCPEKAAETPIRKISRNRGRVVPAALETEAEDEHISGKDDGGFESVQRKRNRCLL